MDIAHFKQTMDRFAVTDYVYDMIDEKTTSAQFDKKFKDLKKLIERLCEEGESPLVIYCFACHGVQSNGY